MLTSLFGQKLVDGFVENKKEYQDLPETDVDARKDLKEKTGQVQSDSIPEKCGFISLRRHVS